MEPSSSARVLPWRETRPADDAPISEQGVPISQAASEPAVAPAAAAPVPAPVPAVAYTTADPEFVSLFVEEARENVTRLDVLFPQWEQNPLDLEALRDLRRAFHTLKGSGRMVGAQRVGEFSWSVESLLNRVISQTLARSPEIVAIVRDAVGVMPQLIDEIDGGPPASTDVARIMMRADALSGREGPALPSSATPTPVHEPTRAPIEAAAQLDSETGADDASMDPVLRDIFRKETAGHILVVREFLERCARSMPPHAVSEALYRACHTLSGISKTAGARQGIKVAQPMEHYVRKLHDNARGLESDALALLHDTVRLLETVSEHVDEASGFFPEQGRLIEGWAALDRALDAELAHLAEAAERTLGDAWRGSDPATQSTAPAPPAPDAIEPEPASSVEPEGDFEETYLESPTELFAEAAPLVDESEETAAASPVAEPVAHVESPHRFGADDLTEPALPSLDEEELGPAGDEFDADIAAIFGEEATELLEQSDACFARWRDDRADRSQVTELKRLLHTLKGGARMAGIRAMGDLSHELESFLASVETGAIASAEPALDVMQASIDELHRMRELANSGLPIAPARDLIVRIRALSGRGEASAAPEPVQPAHAKPQWEPESPVAAGADPIPHFETSAPEPRPARIGASEAVVEAAPARGEPAVPEFIPDLEKGEAASEAASAMAAPIDELETFERERLETAGFVEPLFEPATFEPSVPSIAAQAQPVLPGREPATPTERSELARVDAELLDELLNNAGEVSIFRARIEQQMTSIEFNLAELDRTVTRLREQLRKLEIETETQILHRHQQPDGAHRTDFDPLELDRYSTIQQLSRALAESVSDVASIEGLLDNLNRETQNLLQQQGRIVTEVQNGLMRTRMVPFQRHVQRLTRLLRQAALEAGKKAELIVEGGSGELDRQVLERMLPPFEHMLRNAVIHGLESPAERLAANKPEVGRITMRLQR
jgi:chemosensory pili system protein ChpA (sensor histidine kinase/response regulator)